jgi:phosphatidylglycerophosphatase A
MRVDYRKPYVWLATWFGVGLLPKMPGTWGSLAAIPFGLALYKSGGGLALVVGIIVVFASGMWASAAFDKAVGGHDNKAIVIDEVAGQWIALLPVGMFFNLRFDMVCLAFILFRFFDILKPFPINVLDKRLPGAWGVMLDDVAAGVVSAILLCFVAIFFT